MITSAPKLFHRYSFQAENGLEIFIYFGFVFSHGHGADYFEFREISSGRVMPVENDWAQIMTYVGPPEMVIVPLIEAKEDATKYAQKSNLNALIPFLDYFRDVLEGKDSIESWYTWFNKNADIFERSLTRPDFLRLKTSPADFMERILNISNIPIRRSHRYSWAIGYGRNRTAVFPI